MNRTVKPGHDFAKLRRQKINLHFERLEDEFSKMNVFFLLFPNITFYRRMLQEVNFNVKMCHDVLEKCVKS